MAAGHPLGHPGDGAGPTGGGGPTLRCRPGGRRPRRLPRCPRPGHGHGRPFRCLRVERPRLRWRRPRHVRPERDRRHRLHLAPGRGPPRDLRTRSRSRPPPRGRHPRALAPVHGPVHGGRLAGLSRCGPVLDAVREDRGHGGGAGRGPGRRPRHPHRRHRSPGRHRSRPHPDVRGIRRRPRRHHRRPSPPPRPADGREPPRLRVRRPSPRGWRCAGSSCAGEPRRPSYVSTTMPRARATSTSPTTASSSSSTKPIRGSSTPRWRWWTPNAPPAGPRLSTRDWWSGGCRTATTSRRWRRSTAPASWSTPSRSRPGGRR